MLFGDRAYSSQEEEEEREMKGGALNPYLWFHSWIMDRKKSEIR